MKKSLLCMFSLLITLLIVFTLLSCSSSECRHIPGEAETTDCIAPTCTTEGSREVIVKCTECGTQIRRETEVIEKLPHTNSDTFIEDVIPATCSSEGSHTEIVFCTVCNAEVSRTTISSAKIECSDPDGDFYCNVCFSRTDGDTELVYEWDTTSLIFMMTDSSPDDLTSGCRRYMSGEDPDHNETIDTKVRLRNSNAYSKTKVSVTYDYYQDSLKYGIGSCIEDMCAKIAVPSNTTPDIFCNYLYDMMAFSLKGGLANLYSTKAGKDRIPVNNYFEFADTSHEIEDTGRGWMTEYMKSIALSPNKMYCLASDYFIDTVRSFCVIPVNVKLINEEIPVDLTAENSFNSDRNGDGDFTIDDFYQLIYDGRWNYTALAQFSGAISSSSENNTTTDGRIGFALAQNSNISSAGLFFSSSFSIIERTFIDRLQIYDYYYPDVYSEESLAKLNDFFELSNNIQQLFTNPGIHLISSGDDFATKHSDNGIPKQAIANCFSENGILFGGIVCLGRLDSESYKKMKETPDGGLGVAPIPLYRTLNPLTQEPDSYTTITGFTARIGAVTYGSYKFAQISAFLNYQSTHSSDILHEYYSANFTNSSDKNDIHIQMLDYIRKNLGSNFEFVQDYFMSMDSRTSKASMGEVRSWDEIIRLNEYKYFNMLPRYAELFSDKYAYIRNYANKFDQFRE